MVGGMIEKVLFDLGNVLLRFDFDRAHQGMAKYGARIEDLESEAMTALKIDYETGRITEDCGNGWLRWAQRSFRA